MATILVDSQALADADAFLTAFLTEKVPDADFSQGGVVRDFVVTSIAYVFAFLEQERKTTRDHQSLLSLSTLPESESVTDAVNALLSNWFIGRKPGLQARLTVTLHFSASTDVALTPTTQFFRTDSLVFTPDITTSVLIPSSQLIPTFDSNSVVIDYSLSVRMVAQLVGTAYHMPAGQFVKTDQFNPFFTFAENQSAIQGGKDTESTADLLARAPTAISTRNLVNSRSIDTVLREEFAGLTRVLSVGFGDAEMLRDFSSEAVTHLRMHLGGYTDIYVQLPLTEVVEVGAIGGIYARPDNVIAVFKDVAANFIGYGVVPGDILRITAGLPDVPREYIISSVTATQLTVNPRAAFSEATEEAGTFVSYGVGNTAPSFTDKHSVIRTLVTGGQTSRSVQTANSITLSGRPHYKITKVETFNPLLPLVVTPHGTRTNITPALAGEYQVVGVLPENAQSAYTFDQVKVHTSIPANYSMRVTFDTLATYADIQAFVVDRFERVLAANPLVKGYTPVYLSLVVAYKLRTSATTTLDESAIAILLATYINDFDTTTTLDVTGITTYLREIAPDIGVIVSPTILTYDLFAPDGQVYAYKTKDIVSVFPSYPDNNAQLTNGLLLADFINNATVDPSLSPANEALVAEANTLLRNQLTALGVSDRSLRYIIRVEDISLTQVA